MLVLQSRDSGLAVAGRQSERGRGLRSLGAEFWAEDGRADVGGLQRLVAAGVEKPRTLDQVGRALGLTRERIRQIEDTTLKTLASLPEAQRLNDRL